MLTIENIEVSYYHTVQALRGLSLEVPQGKIVTLLGTNGAGKTTTLKAASNLFCIEGFEMKWIENIPFIDNTSMTIVNINRKNAGIEIK